MDRSRVGTEYEERWFLMQIIVRGSSCLVRIDGETVPGIGRLPAAAQGAGRIGLQIHKENAAAEFRGLRVRPL
jgi:hypothetical protein